jgi:Holliday junction resolvase
MGARSRNKGARAERDVCRLFQRALGGKWSRVPLSGGWANRAEFHTCGDVITTLPDFPFTIEVKCVEGWHLEQLLVSPETCPIATWWRQACRQAEEAGRKPLLVFTRNFQPLLVMLRSTDLPEAPRLRCGRFTVDDEPVAIVALEQLIGTQWVRCHGDTPCDFRTTSA